MIKKIIINVIILSAAVCPLSIASQKIDVPKSVEKKYTITITEKKTLQSNELKISKKWIYEDNGDLHFYQNGKFENNALRINITNTPYSLFILQGRITSYLYDNENHIIWEIEDLTKEFYQATSIEAEKQKIIFIIHGGDMRSFWELDFSSKDQIIIKNYEEYDIY